MCLNERKGKPSFCMMMFILYCKGQKKEFHVLETIQACGTYHTAQVLRRFAEKDASVMEGGPPKAD